MTIARVIGLVLLAACGALQTAAPRGASLAPGAVVASVPIGRGPTLLAISPDGSVVYAASVGQLAVIRTDTNTVTATARIDPYTTGIAVTPDGSRVLLVAMSSSQLTMLSASDPTRATRIALPQPGLHPGGFGRIAVSADGRTAWVVNEDESFASVDLGTGTARQTNLDMRPNDIAVSSDGRTAFIAGCKLICTIGTIEMIDMPSGHVTATIEVGPAPYRLALAPDGRRGYTTNLGGPSLSVVDVVNRTTSASLRVGIEPTGLAVSSDGARVYVTSNRTGSVTIASGEHESVLGTVSVSGSPREIVLAPDGRRAYVATSAPDAVLVLDTSRLSSPR